MYYFTSEYVGRGHPDKVADQISDAVLDSHLRVDPFARVACETMVKGINVILAGEITSAGSVDIERVVRETIRDIGYNDKKLGFWHDGVEVTNLITAQSAEIGSAVSSDGDEIGAGDQGIMFGYATSETPTYMPLTHYLAKSVVETVHYFIDAENSGITYFNPDCKSQVTVRYNDNGTPSTIDTILLSVHHDEGITKEDLEKNFHTAFKNHWLGQLPDNIRNLISNETRYIINPAGEWTIGGPIADCGLTGRKLIVDNYGADCQIGGGAFSGKDATKVDRSAAYMARYVAKNIVAAGIGNKAKIQLSYGIGLADPISIRIQTDSGDSKELVEHVKGAVSFRPKEIIDRFGLRRPVFLMTALKGHFGNESVGDYFKWEALDLADTFSRI